MFNPEEIKKEYEELNQKIQNPDLSKNQAEFRKVSIRLSEVSEIIQISDELEKIRSQIAETEKLVEDSDKDLRDMAVEELETLNAKEKELSEKFTELTAEKDPNDYRNVILEIRAGTGGDEAALFAGDLSRMYLRYAEKKGWKAEVMSAHGAGGGYKEIIIFITGHNIYGQLKYEGGVHRVQRIPATEAAGRIHTSAASVVALPEIEDVEVDIKPEDLKIDVFRAGGPGGQSVNTTDSAVRITHLPTNTVVSIQDEKSQLKNKEKAMKVLKSRLFELKLEEEAQKEGDKRKMAIGSGDRSAKIRTYNFPQSRITDHRIKVSWYNLQTVLDGELDEIISTTKKELGTKK